MNIVQRQFKRCAYISLHNIKYFQTQSGITKPEGHLPRSQRRPEKTLFMFAIEG